MEAIKAIGTTTKNTITSEFFPGLVATWPLLLYVFKWYREEGKGLLGLETKSLNNWEFIVSLILLIVLYGVGHLIGKLGSRLEIILERREINKNEKKLNDCNSCSDSNKIENSIHDEYYNKEEFYNTWYQYLRIAFKNDQTPTLVRYYSSLINAFKFELNMICSIIIMNLSLSLIEKDGWLNKGIKSSIKHDLSLDLFSSEFYFLFTIMSIIVVWYLYYEASLAIHEQHKLRKEFILASKELSYVNTAS